MAALLTIEGVTKSFHGKKLLDGVSLVVDEAERIALVGPNGSGKSTLLSIMAGREQPEAGRRTLRREQRGPGLDPGTGISRGESGIVTQVGDHEMCRGPWAAGSTRGGLGWRANPHGARGRRGRPRHAAARHRGMGRRIGQSAIEAAPELHAWLEGIDAGKGHTPGISRGRDPLPSGDKGLLRSP